MSPIHHFIHFYFFTEFEILFYIYYILPYEKKLVYDMFSINKFISKYDDDRVITLLNNFSNINTNTNKYNDQCASEQLKIDKDNNKLWTYCFIYIMSINVLLLLFFIRDLIINYKCFYEIRDRRVIKQIDMDRNRDNRDNKDKKYNSQSSLTAFGSGNNLDLKYKKTDNMSVFEIDMIDLESDGLGLGLGLGVGVIGSNSGSPLNMSKEKCTEISYNSFCLYYWHKSVMITAIGNTTKFIIIIGIFEYLFFIFIVNKFKIINSDLVLCKILEDL
jgi:hypothetical protein